jgi:hypothetical protein
VLCLSHVGISFCKLFAYYGVSLSLYYLERNRHVINSLRNKFGRHCAMVGYEFLDGESILKATLEFQLLMPLIAPKVNLILF